MHQRYRNQRSNWLAHGLEWAAYTLLGFIVVATLVAGCTPVPTAASTDADRAAMYAAVVRRIVTEDDTFGGTLNPDPIYILRDTDDRAGDLTGPQSESVTLSEDLQGRITEALDDLPATVVWVDSREDVPITEEPARVVGNGAIITLGNIHPQKDGTVHVPGSIWVAMLAAGGQTYVLEQIDGEWTITGTTGPAWIS